MSDPVELLCKRVRAEAKAWRDDAARMRAQGAAGNADTLAYAAAQIEACVEQARAALATVDCGTYAAAQGVSAQTVRTWCTAGQLPGAERLASGEWAIPRTAQRVAPSRTRAA